MAGWLAQPPTYLVQIVEAQLHEANAMAVGVVVLISKYGHEPISKRVFNMHPPASSNAVMHTVKPYFEKDSEHWLSTTGETPGKPVAIQ